jgi:outer membrane immunogenic protein
MKLLREAAIALTVAAASLTAGPAGADDRRMGPAYYDGPAYAPAWQGLYAGVNVGIGDGDGVVGGGQIGYNWQSGRLVYGLEGDFSLSSIEEEACLAGMCISASIDWFATIRGRAGYLIDPRILVYATAGIGIVSWSMDSNIPGLSLPDGTETDVIFGFGVEGRVNDTMTAKLELLTSDELDGEVIRLGLNFKLGR